LEASIKGGELKERVLLDTFGEDFSEEDDRDDGAVREVVTGLVVEGVICCFEF
jgi:hypothetical protein